MSSDIFVLFLIGFGKNSHPDYRFLMDNVAEKIDENEEHFVSRILLTLLTDLIYNPDLR